MSSAKYGDSLKMASYTRVSKMASFFPSSEFSNRDLLVELDVGVGRLPALEDIGTCLPGP